jgi:hypothetical protein
LNEKTPRTSTEFETTELNLPNAAAGGANSALPAKGKSLMEEDIFLHGMNHFLHCIQATIAKFKHLPCLLKENHSHYSSNK